MALTSCVAVQDGRKVQLSIERLLRQVRLCEKQAFSRTEALDFEVELRKRNTQLFVYVDAKHNVVAYVLLAFLSPGRIVNLHKICVHPAHRSRGIATRVLQGSIKSLEARGSSKIQLWVDEGNKIALKLYSRLNFEKIGSVRDYYGPGRTALHMSLCLT